MVKGLDGNLQAPVWEAAERYAVMQHVKEGFK